MIYCRTLGPVEVIVDDAAPPPELLWKKNLALLLYLARSPKRTRTRDHLVGLLWGDKPESAARHSLNEAIRVLRKRIGEGGLTSEGDQLRLAEGATKLDVDELETLVDNEDWGAAAKLVSGDFLEGFFVPGSADFEDWLYAERRQWRQACVDVLVRHAEQLLDGGDARGAVNASQRALGLDPTSNRAARVSTRSVALMGDRAGALELYESFRARLEEEYGIEPDDESRALAERVRRERSWKLPAPVELNVDPGVASRRTPLVGREGELEMLLGSWTACTTAPRATIAIIEGDPGSGKTRLADELAARARLGGATVRGMRAVEADQSHPWAGLFGLVTGALIEAPGVERASPASLAAFAAHAPAWAEQFASEVEGVDPAPPARALSDVLSSILADGPVVLCVDDAHWLDRESLLALAGTLRDVADSPLYIILTTVRHLPRPELDDIRARIARDIEGVTVKLEPLPAPAVQQLARWALPDYDDTELDRVTRRVSTDSAGLPLLVVELLHAIALGLDLGLTEGAWPEPLRTLDQTIPGELPDAVTAAIRIGFRRLSPDAQKVLAAAAVLGDRIELAALPAATGLEGEALAGALDELEWTRWLAADSLGYSFVARILREVVGADMVTPGQRRRILEAADAGSPT